MSKRSKHQKAEFPAKPAVAIPVSDEARERGLAGLGHEPYTYTWHDNEQDNGGAVRYAMGLAAGRFDQGLPPYSPLSNEEFVPTRVCTRREHELLQGRISNQRRELRNLNRAYRRRENENARRITALKERVRLANRATEQRNLKIMNQQREIDGLKRQLDILQNGGRRKRGVRWPRG